MNDLARLFRWNAWANRESLASLVAAAAASPGGAPEKAARAMAHLAGAEWLWISRLRDESSPMAVWPRLGLASVAEELAALESAWARELPRFVPLRLDAEVSYTNSKGEPWTSRAEDVLLHVVFHGAHHRGQIAAELRDAGHEPAYTDYIHAVRTGRV